MFWWSWASIPTRLIPLLFSTTEKKPVTSGPACTCGIHLTYSRNRLGMLNDPVRKAVYHKVMSKVSKTDLDLACSMTPIDRQCTTRSCQRSVGLGWLFLLCLNVTFNVFSAPEPKAQVHYCDHVLSVCPSLTFHIFDFSSETAQQNSTKLYRKQELNVLYQVCVFWADWKNKMAALASDWLRHFWLLL